MTTGNRADGDGVAELVVVTGNAATATAVTGRLTSQSPALLVEQVRGFYPAIAALGRRAAAVVVMDAAVSDQQDEWRLAGLRSHTGAATIVVVADQPQRDALAGAVRADLAVAETRDLPPLRELVTGVTPQTGPARRRTPS